MSLLLLVLNIFCSSLSIVDIEQIRRHRHTFFKLFFFFFLSSLVTGPGIMPIPLLVLELRQSSFIKDITFQLTTAPTQMLQNFKDSKHTSVYVILIHKQ